MTSSSSWRGRFVWPAPSQPPAVSIGVRTPPLKRSRRRLTSPGIKAKTRIWARRPRKTDHWLPTYPRHTQMLATQTKNLSHTHCLEIRKPFQTTCVATTFKVVIAPSAFTSANSAPHISKQHDKHKRECATCMRMRTQNLQMQITNPNHACKS